MSSLLSRLRALWRNLVRRGAVESELDEELQATLDLMVHDHVRGGMAPDNARRTALASLRMEVTKEHVRDARPGHALQGWLEDLSHGVRYATRSPGFAATAILTLSLGMAATTAVSSVLNALMLERLPVKDPDGLFSLTTWNAAKDQRYVPFVAVHGLEQDGPFEKVCGYNGGVVLTTEVNRVPAPALVAFVSSQCFDVFGVVPILGRSLTEEDAPLVRAGNKVGVISHRYWTRMFGADPGVIGQPMKADNAEITVVGVLPPGFGGLHVDAGIDVFAPPDSIIPATSERRPVASEVVGRLRPGLTHAQASAEMAVRWPNLLAESAIGDNTTVTGPDLYGVEIRVRRIGTGISDLRTQYGPTVAIIFALSAALLILACVNLGGLLLSRLDARRTELSVRLALGGSRGRLARQLICESLVLATAAVTLAIPLSLGFVAALVSFMPSSMTGRSISFLPTFRVLTTTILTALFVGVLMTALPIWVTFRHRVMTSAGWDRTIAGGVGGWARRLLIVQVALSVVLVVGAGLLTRSLYLLQQTDLGVTPSGLLTARLMPLPGGYQRLQSEPYYSALLDRVRALPGVGGAALSRSFPRLLFDAVVTVSFVGDDTMAVPALSDAATPEFFSLVGIPILSGRVPQWTDTADTRTVGAVSESLARALSADGDVIGRRIRYGSVRNLPDVLIVGVVGDATMGNPRVTRPRVLWTSPVQTSFQSPELIVATGRDAGDIAAELRAAVAGGGHEYAQEIVGLDDLFAGARANERMSATLAAVIGGFAVLLAVVGLHGALAYQVSRRRREIGVRLAVGAQPRTVAAAVVREGVLIAAIGVALGLPLSLAVSGTLRTLLYGITPSDPLTIAAVCVMFVIVALGACLVPARRAARVDPVTVLRAQ